jgi:hypothetical protein
LLAIPQFVFVEALMHDQRYFAGALPAGGISQRKAGNWLKKL